MSTRRPTRRDERGLAFPSPLVMLSVVAVAMAALAFVLTGNRDAGQIAPPAAQPAAATPTATPTATPSARPTRPTRKATPKPAFTRSQVFVEVFNNSGITGLAARKAGDISGAGWNVIGTDNWYGTIPATTVYYPPRLKAAGRALARDLGVGRVLPAVEPMRFDRLTVILTGE